MVPAMLTVSQKQITVCILSVYSECQAVNTNLHTYVVIIVTYFVSNYSHCYCFYDSDTVSELHKHLFVFVYEVVNAFIPFKKYTNHGSTNTLPETEVRGILWFTLMSQR